MRYWNEQHISTKTIDFLPVCILPMRYWNLSSCPISYNSIDSVCILPMRYWNIDSFSCSKDILLISLYFAYEVLKHSYAVGCICVHIRFVFCLWGIETRFNFIRSFWRKSLYFAYEVLKHLLPCNDFKLFYVCILPMRYWNPKVLFTAPPVNEVCILPMRYWNICQRNF